MKLGLLAMSGIRVQNQELMNLGLTVPGFVERSKVIASLPSLGLLTLAGLTPSAVDVDYVEVPSLPPDGVFPGDFDAVAISSYTAQMPEAYELADRYRRRGTKVILGGLHVSMLPDEAALHADAIVLGEGEIAWPAVIRDLTTTGLKPRYDVRNLDFDLSESPMPRFDLLDLDQYNRLTVQSQRGCPYRCEFCAASLLISPRYKHKPVDRVIAEINQIRTIWSHPFIEFADDNSFCNRTYSKHLLRKMAEHPVRWFTETDLGVADDPELLQLLKDSGCVEVLIGFEALTPAALEGVEQRGNWKAKQLSRYRAAIERIQSKGIAVNGCFVLGLDGHGLEAFDGVWEFCQNSGLYDVQITVQTAFPGTPLYARLQREGRLLRESAWECCTLFDVNFLPARMTVEQLEQGFRELAARIYSDDAIDVRRNLFREQVRSGRSHQPGE